MNNEKKMPPPRQSFDQHMIFMENMTEVPNTVPIIHLNSVTLFVKIICQVKVYQG
jgi:hypothetical protein